MEIIFIPHLLIYILLILQSHQFQNWLSMVYLIKYLYKFHHPLQELRLNIHLDHIHIIYICMGWRMLLFQIFYNNYYLLDLKYLDYHKNLYHLHILVLLRHHLFQLRL